MYSKKDINNSLKKLNISKGDSLYCSTSFGLIGLPKFKHDNIEDICKVFLEILFDIVGDKGTLFVPTFTYSFSSLNNHKKNIFDINNSISKVGPFGEFIRKSNQSFRSTDPMLSIASIGKNKKILKNQSNSSYGKGCAFEILKDVSNLKIVNIGIGANYIPFLHYLDFLVFHFQHQKYPFFLIIHKILNYMPLDSQYYYVKIFFDYL